MKKSLQRIYLGVFIGLLMLPVIGMSWSGEEDYKNCENRELAPLPDFEFSKDYIKAFEVYFNDHFGFRTWMNHWNSVLKYQLFNSSTKPNQAKIGAEGWFFYSSAGDFVLGSYSKTNLLDTHQLAHLQTALEARKALLNEQGIAYHFAVWPNKSTVYSEYVPYGMQILQQDTLSKIDQVIKFFEQKSSGIEIIDVRSELMQGKKERKTYCQHDTHWNSYGAAIAYQKLMKKMGYKPYEMSDFNIEWKSTPKGDLTGFMGLCNSTDIVEELPHFTLQKDHFEIEKIETDIPSAYGKRNLSLKEGKRILVFRDSYASALVPFIELHFKEAYFVWAGYNQEIVDQLKPDIVLEAKVERYF